MRALRPLVGLSVFVAASALWPGVCAANGRFPEAQHVVVGPGERSDTIALRATFGLVASFDGGRSFGWVCEEALYEGLPVGSEVDPAVEVAADGSVVVGFESGVRSVPDLCTVLRHSSADRRYVADLASDPSGADLWAIESERGAVNHVLHARGASLEFLPLGPGVAGTVFSTLDVAPSRTRRIYAAGRDARSYAPRVYRSDDGGETLTLTTGDLGAAQDPYLAAVDPTRPEVVWVRAGAGDGSVLIRSDDSGEHWHDVARTRGPMLGFALDATGRTVWYGGPRDGLFRSDDGGASFQRVSDLGPRCLRHHAGQLWACADWLREPFALGRSRDGGEHFEPVLRFEDLAAPTGCAGASRVASVCGPRWSRVAGVLQSRDAGSKEQADASGIDAGDFDVMRLVTTTRGEAAPRGCGCRATGSARGVGWGLWAALSAVLCARRRVPTGGRSRARP